MRYLDHKQHAFEVQVKKLTKLGEGTPSHFTHKASLTYWKGFKLKSVTESGKVSLQKPRLWHNSTERACVTES